MKYYISSITVLLLLSASSNFAQQKQAQIIVGPNIQVSNDGNFSRNEFMLAANPKFSGNLIAGLNSWALVYSGSGGRIAGYTSTDGGKSWNNFTPAGEEQGLTWDPQVAFSRKGVAYFTGIIDRDPWPVGKDPMEVYMNKHVDLFFYKSIDQGKTWVKSLSPNLTSLLHDHSQMAVDQTKGKYDGRIYISVMCNNPRDTIKFSDRCTVTLLRSDDDGATFTKPKCLATQGIDLDATNQNILISSKGKLYITYVDRKDRSNNSSYRPIYLMSSSDGGDTFSSPQQIDSQHVSFTNAADVDPYTLRYPQFAIDNLGKQYRDRLYCVYDNVINGSIRVMIIYSKDEGKTWSTPKIVAEKLSKGNQYLPAVAVNPKGILGIRWLDTGTIPAVYKDYDEYFTASLDGGETFLPPVKVSDKISKIPDHSGEVVVPIWRRTKEFISLDFRSAFTSPYFGEYMQFASDSNGVFHDFWEDHRDGRSSQAFTSTIEVVQPGEKKYNKDAPYITHLKKKEKKYDLYPKSKAFSNISKYISLQIEPVTYDSVTNILSIPIKLKNVSNSPIYGPIKVSISKIDTTNGKQLAPLILNSDNKKEGAGATFNYNLSGSNILLPEEETTTAVWKFNLKIPFKMSGDLRRPDLKNISDLLLYVNGYLDVNK